jgi:hypothetical protein
VGDDRPTEIDAASSQVLKEDEESMRRSPDNGHAPRLGFPHVLPRIVGFLVTPNRGPDAQYRESMRAPPKRIAAKN